MNGGFMSKFLEILKDILSVAMAIMLLVYIVKYRESIDKIIELQKENSTLRQYLWQDYKNSTDDYLDRKYYPI